MLRRDIPERPRWKEVAQEYGFHFHTMYGEPYWCEEHYYQFTLEQIENDLEAPTEELHQMCLHVVDNVVKSEELLTLLAIPKDFWQPILTSWQNKAPSLYSRLDFSYNGKQPAKLLENNADTPTSLYETGFWQWLWLEQNVDMSRLPAQSDQFNSLQEKLIAQLHKIAHFYQTAFIHFACCKDTVEDRGTVQYLQDCAAEAGINTQFSFIEELGSSHDGYFTDEKSNRMDVCFKLYPWEFMQRDDFASELVTTRTKWIEPIWKTILSNKGVLPLLWREFENHPNLLPAFFEHETNKLSNFTSQWIRKPIYSREGANISLLNSSSPSENETPGPYGEEGFIYQQFSELPKFSNKHTLIGSWLVDDKAAGISVREDTHFVTQDMSQFLPHIIV